MAKKYTLRGEVTPGILEQIDEMLDDLYQVTSSATHELLSATHEDTVASTVVRGDIIVGNSTPAWEALPLATTSTHFIGTDGFDVVWRAIQETDIVDGSLLARVGSTETITGAWRFNTAPTLANGIWLNWRNSGDSADVNVLRLTSTTIVLGSNQGPITVSASTGGISFLIGLTTTFSLAASSATWASGVNVFHPGVGATTLSAGNNNNIVVNAWRHRLTGNATTSVVTGVTATGTAGEVKVLTNVGTVSITLAHESASSTATNRLKLQDAADLTLPAGYGVMLQWDTTSQRWEQMSSLPAASATINPDDVRDAGLYTPLTNGDAASPALVFASGDVIMVWSYL